MKKYYARIDTTVSKQNPGHGFCNSKEIVCFSCFADRKNYLLERSTYDFTCISISYKDAIKERFTDYDPDLRGCYNAQKEFIAFGPQIS